MKIPQGGLEVFVDALKSKDMSCWAILVRSPAVVAPLVAADPRWERLPWTAGKPVGRRHLWTNDFSSLFAVMR